MEDRNNGCRVSYLNGSEYNCTVSTKMYYVLPTKTIQGSSAVVGLFFKKGVLEFVLNPTLIYLQRVSKNLFLKLNYLKDISQGIWSQLLQ